MEEEDDPKVEKALLVEPVNVLVVDIADDIDTKEVEVSYTNQMKVVFAKSEEELIDFLNRYKLKDFEVMLCPCYNAVFD